MSIRRKSCEPCFRGRRKCDLAYPVCERCQKNSKACHYVYPPQLPMRDDTITLLGSTITQSVTGVASSYSVSYPRHHKQKGDGYEPQFQLDRSLTRQLNKLQCPSIPKLLGHLGELEPVVGKENWAWVFGQIQNCPLAFATQAETVFIHKSLYPDSFPRPLRAAFGICAGSLSLNERNQSVLFQTLDAEITELLTPALTSTLLDDLVRLQAAVLYQIIRLFYGGIEQRIVAERQEFLLRSYGLTVLQRADAELRNAQRTWENWLLAESIRRTVLIAFKLYTLYSNFRYRICSEMNALVILPVSTKPDSWTSREAYLQYPEQDDTIAYADFSSYRATVQRREVEPFEKLLLVGCTGIERFEDVINNQSVEN